MVNELHVSVGLTPCMPQVLSNWTRECADSPEDMAQFLFPLKDPLLKVNLFPPFYLPCSFLSGSFSLALPLSHFLLAAQIHHGRLVRVPR